MKYNLELWHKGECLEQRTFDHPPWGVPAVGDLVRIEFSNPNYTEEYGSWWEVKQRRVLLFSNGINVQTVQLFCDRHADPDAKRPATFGEFSIG
ncbi:MAG TPA: hypothetical protein VHE78_05405 [Gemmatimonadaceae bacterium]|nr:hypothetical protein [Gemmatimonadaceae bacterium]